MQSLIRWKLLLARMTLDQLCKVCFASRPSLVIVRVFFVVIPIVVGI
jgi:hypothetical protein